VLLPWVETLRIGPFGATTRSSVPPVKKAKNKTQTLLVLAFGQNSRVPVNQGEMVVGSHWTFLFKSSPENPGTPGRFNSRSGRSQGPGRAGHGFLKVNSLFKTPGFKTFLGGLHENLNWGHI